MHVLEKLAKKKRLKVIAKELHKASKMHKNQAERIESLISKTKLSSPALNLISSVGPGAALGYQLGRETSRQTAAAIAPKGKKTRTESIADKLSIPTTVLGALGAMYLTKDKALHASIAKGLKGKLKNLSAPERRQLVQLALPALSGIAGGTAAGAATGLTTGGVARLSNRKRKRSKTKLSWDLSEKLKSAAAKRDPRLERAGVSGYNKPKRTPGHPTKSHIVVAKEGDRIKTIRFGQQGVKTNQTAGQREALSPAIERISPRVA